MKTVTSEGNLTRYVAVEKGLQIIDPVALNRKIKSMKSALKLSERHNKDLQRHNKELHLEIKTLKESNIIQQTHLQSQCRKYKQLYEVLSGNYELRGAELKECRKLLKRMEAEKMTQFAEEAEETAHEYRETIVKQEKELVRLREQNALLYDQLYQKTMRMKQLQPLLLKNYNCKNDKDKMFLASLKTALEAKNEEFQKIIQEKSQLAASRTSLQKDNAELGLKLAKATAELECERRAAGEAKNRQQKQFARLEEELRALSGKYNELLGFSYEMQKEFERELQVVLKEVGKKDNKR